MDKKNYVGLACTGHDNALAIVNSEGEVVFAEATERYLQNKRSLNTPPDDPIRIGKLIEEYCEPDAELVVARSWSDDAKDLLTKEASDTPSIHSGNKYTLSFVADNVNRAGMHLLNRHAHGLTTRRPRKVSFRSYDHHLTHAATGCYSSPFDEALCAVVDGFGENASCAFYTYQGGEIREIDRTGNARLSLGGFFSRLCALCGFDPWRGEEWKVMGLAPYGSRNDEIYDLMRRAIHVSDLKLSCPPEGERAFFELGRHARKPGAPPLSVADLAFTGQLVFCELMFELLENLQLRGSTRNLILMGGCALNSSCNGKILKSTGFEQLHVYSAPADDGNAVGAALVAYYEDHTEEQKGRKPERMKPYLGSKMDREALHNLERFGKCHGLSRSPENVVVEAARLLADGKIIGWVQGRAEFGPRALGNRSILADPRPETMKDRINEQVKFREEFRPFAPSIMAEHGSDYFEDYQESPYMERTLVFKEEVRGLVPAVVHHDFTGRLQTVARDWNPLYYDLIKEFYRLTGVPLILNTSFNVMGKPIIHSVEDAISVFYTTGLDALIIDDYILTK